MLGANNTGLPEGKQSGMRDSRVAVEQYRDMYASVDWWVLKPSCFGEMLLFSEHLN